MIAILYIYSILYTLGEPCKKYPYIIGNNQTMYKSGSFAVKINNHNSITGFEIQK